MNILMGERIKHARKKQGLTLEKLSEKVGISRNFLWEIEDGRKAPAVTTLYNICNELQVSADYLFGFSSIYNPQKKDKKDDNIVSICNIIGNLNEGETETLYELLKTYDKCKK